MSFYLNCSLICSLCHWDTSGKNISKQIINTYNENILCLDSCMLLPPYPLQRQQPSYYELIVLLGNSFSPITTSRVCIRILFFLLNCSCNMGLELTTQRWSCMIYWLNQPHTQIILISKSNFSYTSFLTC